MLPPEIAYKFQQAIDLTSSSCQIIHRELTTSVAQAIITSAPIYTVPNDRVLILGVACGTAIAGAALFANLMGFRVAQETGGDIEFAVFPEGRFVTAAATEQQIRGNWQGEIWVPPGGSIIVNAQFSGAAAVNNLTLRIFGLSIPRANVAQG